MKEFFDKVYFEKKSTDKNHENFPAFKVKTAWAASQCDYMSSSEISSTSVLSLGVCGVRVCLFVFLPVCMHGYVCGWSKESGEILRQHRLTFTCTEAAMALTSLHKWSDSP